MSFLESENGHGMAVSSNVCLPCQPVDPQLEPSLITALNRPQMRLDFLARQITHPCNRAALGASVYSEPYLFRALTWAAMCCALAMSARTR